MTPRDTRAPAERGTAPAAGMSGPLDQARIVRAGVGPALAWGILGAVAGLAIAWLAGPVSPLVGAVVGYGFVSSVVWIRAILGEARKMQTARAAEAGTEGSR